MADQQTNMIQKLEGGNLAPVTGLDTAILQDAGKYNVDLNALENIASPNIKRRHGNTPVVIDVA